jgi:hypothetical protein
MGNIQPGTKKIGSGNFIGESKYAYGKYDFATLGGTIGAITLTGDTIPAGAVILDSFLIVDVAPDSAAHTATIAVSVESANDIVSAVVVSNATWTGLSAKRGAVTGSTTALPTTTAARPIVATVAVQNLTVGTFRVVVEYAEVL